MRPATGFLTAAILIGVVAPARAAEIGQVAPTFEADSSSRKISLADFRGKKNVLLAFYYADFTGG